MEDWMEFSFCHFNDYRNVVEAWKRDPKIINRRVGLPQTISHIILWKISM